MTTPSEQVENIVSDMEDVWDDIIAEPWATFEAVRLPHPLDRFVDTLRQFPIRPLLLGYLLAHKPGLLDDAVVYFQNTLAAHTFSPEDEKKGVELLLKRMQRVWQFRGMNRK